MQFSQNVYGYQPCLLKKVTWAVGCWVRVASSTWNISRLGQTNLSRFQASFESNLEVCR